MLIGGSHIVKTFSRRALRKRSRRCSRDDFATHRGPQGRPSIPFVVTKNHGFQGCLAICTLQEPSQGTRHAKRSRRCSRDHFGAPQGPQGGPRTPFLGTENHGFRCCLVFWALDRFKMPKVLPPPLSQRFWGHSGASSQDPSKQIGQQHQQQQQQQ